MSQANDFNSRKQAFQLKVAQTQEKSKKGTNILSSQIDKDYLGIPEAKFFDQEPLRNNQSYNSAQNLHALTQVISHMSSVSKSPQKQTQSTKKSRDFGAEYRKLAQSKVYDGQGQSVLVPEDELRNLYYYSTLSSKDFLERNQQFQKTKDEKLNAERQKKKATDLDECTFVPETLSSRGQSGLMPRDVDQFIKDQEAYLNAKNQAIQMQQEIRELTTLQQQYETPKIDDLSRQIVELMGERKNEPAHDRLYKLGKEKLRNLEQNRSRDYTSLEATRTDISYMNKTLGSSAPRRGKEIRSALHDLAVQIKNHKELLKKKAEQDLEDKLKADTFVNKESEEYRVKGFQKEFKLKLAEVIGDKEGMILPDPKEHKLNYSQLVKLMKKLGFLPLEITVQFENKINDLYAMFKVSTEDEIIAENLMTVLMVISGGLPVKEIEGESHTEFEKVGVMEGDFFKLKTGESGVIQHHFELLKITRMQLKKSVKQYLPPRPNSTFVPTISEATKKLAEQKRQKIGVENSNIVNLLLSPSQFTKSTQKVEQLKKLRNDSEEANLTFKPKVNQHITLASPRSNLHEELYKMSKLRLRKEISRDEYEFKQNEKELKFKPELTAKLPSKKSLNKPKEIKGYDEIVKRMKKGNLEREFKNRMTERSNFTPAEGIKKAKKLIKKGVISVETRNQISVHLDPKTKYQSAFGAVDGSQIIVLRKPVKLTKTMPPLHQPKTATEVKSYKDLRDVISPSSANRKKKKKTAQKSEDQDESRTELNFLYHDRGDPKLYVDVNIGKSDGMERIIVYEGDTAKKLAAEFCMKHGLSPDMREKLEMLLDQQIAAVLPQIQEDEDVSDEELDELEYNHRSDEDATLNHAAERGVDYNFGEKGQSIENIEDSEDSNN